ncbi:hypothetical protein WMZ97_20045 [Lentibacillus sp. N15]|uniref:hypothetical protein n=1 Tax=Lentibacillus songyuanensis TaxID=3136161 RepID=UPI0031BA8CA2
MPRLFVHFTFLLFTLTALSGLWMRLHPFYPGSTFTYTNVMHGHSHLAILGWAFMGTFLIFLTLFWKSIKQKKQATVLTVTLFIMSVFMFASFIYQGYGVISIIFSTLHILVEFWAALFMYRQTRRMQQIPYVGRLFINGALIALLISAIGPFSLGFISASGLRNNPIFDMAIYFYLHFQYNGWLSLMLIGLFIIVLHRRKIPFQHMWVKIAFWFYFVALFPGYLLSILWSDIGNSGSILADIGSIGQWIGVVCLVFAFKEIWVYLYKQAHEITIVSLWITFFLLIVKSTMELGLISPTMADLVYQTRSIIIGYLHFTLLGFISIFILTQYQLTKIIHTKKKQMQSGMIIFLIGFFLNELFLFGDGLARWCGLGPIPYAPQGLLGVSVLLVIGIVMMWLAFFRQKKLRL